jgi:hypothetical protein
MPVIKQSNVFFLVLLPGERFGDHSESKTFENAFETETTQEVVEQTAETETREESADETQDTAEQQPDGGDDLTEWF